MSYQAAKDTNHSVEGLPESGGRPHQDDVAEVAQIYLAGGCFWGVERFMWQTPGVVETRVGYMGGSAPNPTYVQVCTGTTGHAETVRVTYDPKVISTAELLAVFFESHDPTTLNRQGNDLGSQYRSAIWTTTPDQFEGAQSLKSTYTRHLLNAGKGPVVTEIHAPEPPAFNAAEEHHQKYLRKNPGGYCNHGFNGVQCPRGVL